MSFIDDFARNLQNKKSKASNYRGWTDEPYVTGIAGEKVFAELKKLSVNTDFYPHKGDGGKDFLLSGKRIQIKTANVKPNSPYLPDLLVEVKEAKGDFYVLVQHNLDDSMEVIGWCDQSTVLAAPKKMLLAYDYVVRRKLLRPMSTFPLGELYA